MKNWMLGILLTLVMLCSLSDAQNQAKHQDTNNQTASVSGTALIIPNTYGAMAATFEVIITGSPGSSSVLIQGCMRGGTCDTLTTYTGNAAKSNQKPSITTVYDEYHVTPSWTGGSAPTISINTTQTTAGIHSGGGSGVTSVSGGTGLDGGTIASGQSGTLSISPSYQEPQGCGNGVMQEWNGSAWACFATTRGGINYADNNDVITSRRFLATKAISYSTGASSMCADINAAYTQVPLFGVDASSYSGTQACGADQAFPNSNATPLYLGPSLTWTTDVPIVIPTATPVIGADIPSASAPGTVIQATNNLQSKRVISIASWAIVSNVITFTAANWASAGQSVVLSGFGNFLDGNTVVVCAGLNCGNSSNGLTNAQFQAPFVHGDTSGTTGTGTLTFGPALVTWGSFGTGGSGGVSGGGQFNSRLESVRVDGNSKTVTCVFVYAAQEHTYLHNSQVVDCGNSTNPGIAVDVESSHSQHFTMDHVQVFNRNAASCHAQDKLLVLNGAIDFSMDYTTFTVQACSGADFSVLPLTEVTIDNSQQIKIGPHYNHFEGPDGTPTGTPVAQNIIRIGDTTGNTGVTIDGMSGGNFQNEAAGSTMIEIANNGNKSINILNPVFKGSQSTNVLVDNQNCANTITRTNNTGFTYYSFVTGLPRTDAIAEAGLVAYISDQDGLSIKTCANGTTAPITVATGVPTSNFPTLLSLTAGANAQTTNQLLANFAATANNSGLTFNGMNFAITNTSSAAGSTFFTLNGGAAGATLEGFWDLTGNIRVAGTFGTTTNSTNATYFGGSGTASVAGGVAGSMFRGEDNTNTGSAAAQGGYAILRGGGNTGTTVTAGAAPGLTEIAFIGEKTTIAAANHVVCSTATLYNFSDCPVGGTGTLVGVATNTTNPISIVTHGLVPIVSDNTAVVGDVFCRSTTTAGDGHDNGTAPCPAFMDTLGVVVDITAHNVNQAAGNSVAAATISSSLPVISLTIAPAEAMNVAKIHTTGLTAAVATATLCASSAGACNIAGQYRVSWNFSGGGTACSSVTAGSVTFLLTWTDSNAIVHSAVALQMMSQTGAATTAMGGTFPFQTALANEGASGTMVINTNGAIIQYATGYTTCTTGTGNYTIDVAVDRLQ